MFTDESRFSNLEIDAETPAPVAPPKAPTPVAPPVAPPAPAPLTKLYSVQAVLDSRPGMPMDALLAEIRTAALSLEEGSAEHDRLRRMWRAVRDHLTAKAPVAALTAITAPAPTPAPVAAPVSVVAPPPGAAALAVGQWPFPAPAGFDARTSGGTPMGSRMARFYGALHSKGIRLHTMSTDTMVQSLLPQLRAFQAEISATIACGSAVFANELLDLRDDVEAIMNRVPANRSQGSTVAAAPVAPTTTVVDPQRLVAMGEHDNTTGAVVFWNSSGGASVADYSAACDAEGLDSKQRAEAPSRDVAFGRAVKAEECKSVDVVAAKARLTWVRVQRGLTADGAVVLGEQIRLSLDKEEDKIAIAKRVDETWEQYQPEMAFTQVSPALSALRSRVAAAYSAAREQLTGSDITDWLVGLVGRLGGVPLRGRGGVYFIPKAGVATYQAAQRVVAKLGAAEAHEIPALRGNATASAITAALAAEVTSVCEGIEGEIAAEIGLRAAKNRVTEIAALVGKVGQYETLFGVRLDAARVRLDKVSKALGEVTTRTAQLEID